ncbi:ferredoxin/menaquinone-dependent protoporphyrinogen IX oxidase [Clostridium tetanomorphum]|uniref:Ferredoxin n=1 Tax=Clostridium tetanomorphum TaxID=1553 RepID=A0A923J3E4_CLOTT|nr:EFR1 family ferrodoxin [Clostridium tetanomorphum]MBC2400178.1 4Fe-4S binding protein [Clostridium tetanomorphum]MBP1866595.1 ferredoxin/menaquinone-dependent protoporphyrinogen IX oxidase [Clostridium tetanomorphum]NRS86676.1 ferredoxin/menaquinone-dependent protoporphyrinogen IX oxidase [Clostridium tetanomorphum]NRZ95318.1 ferredoxin [Clostridium tetanomorphum]SQC00533.1 polyferredoxin [Clostridium tetanomorphum]
MKGILYYFSGTGNTKWIADKFKNAFNKNEIYIDLVNIENAEEIEIKNYDFLIIGTSIYAGLQPKIVDSFIEKLPNGDFMKVMVYSTQAAKSASAVAILKKNLEKKGYKVYSQSMFQMSNNYYFAVGKKTDKSTFKIIIDKAEQEVNETVKDFIENRERRIHLNSLRVSIAKFVGKNFNKILPKMSKNLTSTEECIKCGLCLRNCPKGNITFENGHAVFHSKCILCMRCIHICPINVIRYKGEKIDQTQKNMIKSLILK